MAIYHCLPKYICFSGSNERPRWAITMVWTVGKHACDEKEGRKVVRSAAARLTRANIYLKLLQSVLL